MAAAAEGVSASTINTSLSAEGGRTNSMDTPSLLPATAWMMRACLCSIVTAFSSELVAEASSDATSLHHHDEGATAVVIGAPGSSNGSSSGSSRYFAELVWSHCVEAYATASTSSPARFHHLHTVQLQQQQQGSPGFSVTLSTVGLEISKTVRALLQVSSSALQRALLSIVLHNAPVVSGDFTHYQDQGQNKGQGRGQGQDQGEGKGSHADAVFCTKVGAGAGCVRCADEELLEVVLSWLPLRELYEQGQQDNLIQGTQICTLIGSAVQGAMARLLVCAHPAEPIGSAAQVPHREHLCSNSHGSAAMQSISWSAGAAAAVLIAVGGYNDAALSTANPALFPLRAALVSNVPLGTSLLKSISSLCDLVKLHSFRMSTTAYTTASARALNLSAQSMSVGGGRDGCERKSRGCAELPGQLVRYVFAIGQLIKVFHSHTLPRGVQKILADLAMTLSTSAAAINRVVGALSKQHQQKNPDNGSSRTEKVLVLLSTVSDLSGVSFLILEKLRGESLAEGTFEVCHELS